MSEGEPDRNIHPEGLSPAQEGLADALFTTRTVAKVRRRFGEPGNWIFDIVERPTSPVDFALDGEFALKMHETHPDAPLSPIYFNLRKHPEPLLDQMALAMADVPSDGEPSFIVGIPDAGTPIADAYSRLTGIPHVHVLGKAETDEGRRIVGVAQPEASGAVRVIDDLVTAGHTKIETIDALRGMGIPIIDLTVLIDREQGARYDLAQAGVELRSVFTMTQLLDYYLRVGHIEREQYDRVKEYLAGQS